MRAWQAHYTSCQHGRGATAGQQFRAVTAGLPSELEHELETRMVYGLPDSAPPTPDREARRRLPVTFRSETLGAGERLLLHIAYAGQDYTGRWGNTFGHALVVPLEAQAQASQLVARWPIDLSEWAGWVSELRPDDDHLDPPPLDAVDLAGIPGTPSYGFDELAHFLREASGRTELLAGAVRAMLRAPLEARPLVILAESAIDAGYWVACLQKSLPSALAWRVSFSTWHAPTHGLAQVNGTVAGTPLGADTRDNPGAYLLLGERLAEDDDHEHAAAVAAWMEAEAAPLLTLDRLADGFTPGPDLSSRWRALVALSAWAEADARRERLPLGGAWGSLLPWARPTDAVAEKLVGGARAALARGEPLAAAQMLVLATGAGLNESIIDALATSWVAVDAAPSAESGPVRALRREALGRAPDVRTAWARAWKAAEAVAVRVARATTAAAGDALALLLDAAAADAFAEAAAWGPACVTAAGAEGPALRALMEAIPPESPAFPMIPAAVLSALSPPTLTDIAALLAARIPLEHAAAGAFAEALAPSPAAGAAWLGACSKGAPPHSAMVRLLGFLESLSAGARARLLPLAIEDVLARMDPAMRAQEALLLLVGRWSPMVSEVAGGVVLDAANEALAFGRRQDPADGTAERVGDLARRLGHTFEVDRPACWSAIARAQRSNAPCVPDDFEGLRAALDSLPDDEYGPCLRRLLRPLLLEHAKDVRLHRAFVALTLRAPVPFWNAYADVVLAKLRTDRVSVALFATLQFWVGLTSTDPGIGALRTHRDTALSRLADVASRLSDSDWGNLERRLADAVPIAWAAAVPAFREVRANARGLLWGRR